MQKKSIDQEQNKQTMFIAEQIHSQRLLDLQSGKYKLKYLKQDWIS
jgi:hypothetical protein